MTISNPVKKMGWFRPAYYFIPPAFHLLAALVAVYFWTTSAKEVFFWVGLAAGATGVLQLIAAVREYGNWMLNWELLGACQAVSTTLEELFAGQVGNDANGKPAGNFESDPTRKIHLRNAFARVEDYPQSPNIQRIIRAGRFTLCRIGTPRVTDDPDEVTCCQCKREHATRTDFVGSEVLRASAEH